MEIRDAVAEDAPAACQVLRRPISELCVADHGNDPTILMQWLSNKTPEIVASWIASPNNSLLVAVDAALRTAPHDPQVNLTAYVLATERGEEYRGPQAHEWFEKAVRLSGDDGPVRSISLQQLAEDVPDWNERVENAGRLLRQTPAPCAAFGRRENLLPI